MNEKLILIDNIQSRIFTFRGLQVMIDRDLAEIYGVEVKRLNEQVKRNINRFPAEFRFQLIDHEKNELVANCDRFQNIKYSSVNPYAFTEQGVSMLSAVLRSDTAVEVSIKIINAFVEMRKFISYNADIFNRLDKVEIKQIENENKILKILEALESDSIKPKQGIFFDGQIFDAYVFVADLIKKAKSSIILIDNFIDESILILLSKRNKNVTATIYTKNITKQLKLDLQKHNNQYPEIKINELKESHDRFIIIDKKELYHFGASLKDLGKKWFAFSKMDNFIDEVLNKLKYN